LTTRLSPTYTFDTSLVFPVYVPKGPSFPNLPLGWGIGIVFGLFLGALAAMARNAVRRATTR
ncbi:MAG TPA: lipopolysaccharide biosynthesis protein, partial [Pinirhizobacter sp.]|nr:lipopolysaccharide biosynthesis protein [Pinirhizobacter sp.]